MSRSPGHFCDCSRTGYGGGDCRLGTYRDLHFNVVKSVLSYVGRAFRVLVYIHIASVSISVITSSLKISIKRFKIHTPFQNFKILFGPKPEMLKFS